MKHAVEIQSGGQVLDAMLHLPDAQTAPSRTMLVWPTLLSHKVGPSQFFVRLAVDLEQRHVATLRVDPSGQGDSPGTFADVTLSAHIRDLAAACRFVQSDALLAGSPIVLLAHGTAAITAALYASIHPQALAQVVFVCPDFSFADLLKGRFGVASEESEFVEVFGQRAHKKMVHDYCRYRLPDDFAGYTGPVFCFYNQDNTRQATHTRQTLDSLYKANAASYRIPGLEHQFHDLQAQGLLFQLLVDAISQQ